MIGDYCIVVNIAVSVCEYILLYTGAFWYIFVYTIVYNIVYQMHVQAPQSTSNWNEFDQFSQTCIISRDSILLDAAGMSVESLLEINKENV